MRKSNKKTGDRKDKKFIPQKGLNRAKLSLRIEQLSVKIEKNKQIDEMQRWAMFNYIELFTNFASHDLKNAVHNLDGTVNTLDLDNITTDDIETINENVDIIRITIANFQKLGAGKAKSNFKISDLKNSLELLNRGILNLHNIELRFEVEETDEIVVNHYLHDIIQATNNLIINSVKALENVTEAKQLYIKIENKEDQITQIIVADNGCGIAETNKNKIFEHHFTTTGGTGIGLFHATHTFENINGSIKLDQPFGIYKTVFKIIFPTK